MSIAKRSGEAVILAIMGVCLVGGIVMWLASGEFHMMPVHGSRNSHIHHDNYGLSHNSNQLDPRSRDHDSDGVPNHLDRDDDNDGRLDDYDSRHHGR
jgi:hypothetical protein